MHAGRNECTNCSFKHVSEAGGEGLALTTITAAPGKSSPKKGTEPPIEMRPEVYENINFPAHFALIIALIPQMSPECPT